MSIYIICIILLILSLILVIFFRTKYFPYDMYSLDGHIIQPYGEYDINFVNTCELVRDTRRWAEKLPRDYDAIIGIPKSGLIVASVLATLLDKPVGTIENLLSGYFYEGTSKRYGNENESILSSNKLILKKVLIVDDTICMGTQIDKMKNYLNSKNTNIIIEYGALYIDCDKYKIDKVDHFYKILKSKSYPRRFEWNLVKSEIWKHSCSDLDGVLCYDPDPRIKDNSDEYLYFLDNAKIMLKPGEEIHTIVTGRNEKFRKQTENWLRQNGFKYKNLIMSNNSDHSKDAYMKANVYKNNECTYFIESSSQQARIISKESNKPVFCTENMLVY